MVPVRGRYFPLCGDVGFGGVRPFPSKRYPARGDPPAPATEKPQLQTESTETRNPDRSNHDWSRPNRSLRDSHALFSVPRLYLWVIEGRIRSAASR